MNWSSRSLASSFHHDIFRCLVRWGCRPAANLLLYPVVGYYTLSPAVRRRCRPYLERRFDCDATRSGEGLWRHTWRLYKTFGDILFNRLEAGVTGQVRLLPSPEHFACFTSALSEGRGCIALSAHVGAWQSGVAALEALNVPIWLLQHRDPGDVDKHYFEQQSGHQVGVINSSGPFGGLVDCASALRRGEVVCIMGDRLRSPDEPTLAIPFMGTAIQLPVAPYALASLTGAPLVLTFALHTPEGIRGQCAGVVRVPPGVRGVPERIMPYAQIFVSALEQLVQDHPYQFFNFFDMWSPYDTRRNG